MTVTFQPTQLDDGGPGSGSLRDLILQANASGEDTVIELQASSVLTLSIDPLGAAEDDDAGLTGDLDVVNGDSGTTLTIRGLGSGATIDAGGIDRVFEVASGSQLVLENVTVTGGSIGSEGTLSSSTNGGGIAVGAQSTLTVTNGTIADNTAAGTNSGGGIANDGGTVNLNAVTIASNSAGGNGGGVFQGDGTLTIDGSTIENNSAGGSGGGVASDAPIGATDDGVFVIADSTITGNTASFGGGVSSEAGTISNSTVENNTASQGGGIGVGGILSIVDSRVANNTAASGGGVFAASFGTTGDLDIINSTIESNTATATNGEGGGGIGSDGTPLFLYNSEVLNNTSAENGGGVSVGFTNLVSALNSTIANNTSAGEGGGIATIGTNAFVAFSTISGNTAGSGGGGISAGPGAIAIYSVNITNSTIANNTANGNGGGIEVFPGVLDGVVDYVVGDIYYGYENLSSAPTNATIVNSTIVGNVADADSTGGQGGGGLAVLPLIQLGADTVVPGIVTLQNSIVSGNSDTPNNAGIEATSPDIFGPVRGNSNNLFSSTAGAYQVLLDPDATVGGPNDIIAPDVGLGPLADNGGDTQTIALLPGSPAIDAGDNGAIAPDAFDADDDGDTAEPVPFEQRFTSAEQSGLPRIFGAAVDIGAFEFGNTPPADDPNPDNSPPTITSAAAASVPENTLEVVTIAASDADGDALSFSLSGGADRARFAIDAVTGLLTFETAPDFENPSDADGDNLFEVEVAVSDGTNAPAIQELAIAVTDDPADDPTDASPDAVLDPDGNGSIEPLTDGLNILRVLLGAPVQAIELGDEVAAGISQQGVADRIAAAGETLDVDGNGSIEPLTDGLNILRVLLGAPVQAIELGAGTPAAVTQETVAANINALT